MHSSLKETRTEAKTKRLALTDAEAKLKKYQDAEAEAERAGMTELQKIQTDNQTLTDTLTKTQAERDSALAKLDFYQAGVSDIESVSALWNALPPDQKQATTAKDWSAALKEQKPHLFGIAQAPSGFGGNPNTETTQTTRTGSGGVITHPKNLQDVNQFWADFDKSFAN